MPPTRYMVRARDENGALAEFLRSLQGDPSITLEDQIGPPGKPHTLVVSVAPEQAAQLEARVRASDQLTLEHDRPLSLF
jgi:hypothetical protein